MDGACMGYSDWIDNYGRTVWRNKLIVIPGRTLKEPYRRMIFVIIRTGE